MREILRRFWRHRGRSHSVCEKADERANQVFTAAGREVSVDLVADRRTLQSAPASRPASRACGCSSSDWSRKVGAAQDSTRCWS